MESNISYWAENDLNEKTCWIPPDATAAALNCVGKSMDCKICCSIFFNRFSYFFFVRSSFSDKHLENVNKFVQLGDAK